MDQRRDQARQDLNGARREASYFDEQAIRRTATQRGIPLITTLSGSHAVVEAIRSLRAGALTYRTLQEIYAGGS